MFSNIHGILIYLITSVFDIFLYILIFRFILAAVGAYGSEPLIQVIVKLTTFVTTPVRKFIPDYRNYEIGTLTLIFVLAFIKNFLRIVIPFGFTSVVGLFIGVIIMAIGDVCLLFSTTIFVIILIKALLSWIQPTMPNSLLDRIANPILRPFQRIIPPVNGLDFSPIIPLIGLQLLNLFVFNLIIAKGSVIALG